MACGEFSLIARYFDRVRSSRLDVELGIGDDCALLNIPEKQTLAISTDTLVAGNHFLPDIDPADLAYKALAVNLSDLAAMGADPAWLTLALTLPDVDEAWLESFSDSLFDLLNYYDNAHAVVFVEQRAYAVSEVGGISVEILSIEHTLFIAVFNHTFTPKVYISLQVYHKPQKFATEKSNSAAGRKPSAYKPSHPVYVPLEVSA